MLLETFRNHLEYELELAELSEYDRDSHRKKLAAINDLINMLSTLSKETKAKYDTILVARAAIESFISLLRTSSFIKDEDRLKYENQFRALPDQLQELVVTPMLVMAGVYYRFKDSLITENLRNTGFAFHLVSANEDEWNRIFSFLESSVPNAKDKECSTDATLAESKEV